MSINWFKRLKLKYGIYALVLLVPFIAQAPQTIGIVELAYILLFGATGIGWVIKHRLFRNIHALSKSPITLGLVAFLGVCVATLPVALANATAFSDWARGLIPFVNLVIFFVAATELRTEADMRHFLWAVFAAALILFAQAVSVIVREQLWVPVPLPAGETSHLPLVYRRITLLFAASTSPLLLVGAMIATTYALLTPTKWRLSIFVLAQAALINLVLWTWSRTALLALAIGTAVLIGLLVYRKLWRALARLPVILVIVGLLNAWVFYNLQVPIADLIMGRIEQGTNVLLTRSALRTPTTGETPPNSSETTQTPTPNSSETTGEPPPNSTDPATDVNVTTRFEEYRIAFELFRTSPLMGKGLGFHYPIWQDKELVRVPYVHNFIAYFMMTTGLMGTWAYVLMLGAGLAALWTSFSTQRFGETMPIVLLVLFVVLLVDALLFAVFRLIIFNLFIGTALGAAQAAITREN